jgi:drug/metabolite transporter (DMT)-like permease
MSRVVPIVGSLIPILTLIGTATFLGERLSLQQLVGFGVLILATVILSSSGGKAHPTAVTVAFAVGSAALFAISSVTGKAVYDSAGFLSGFISTRLAAAATSLVLVTLADPAAGEELWGMIRPRKDGKGGTTKKAAGLAFLGQSLGAVGFLFVQLGVARGSAAIVNAMQAVQYAFLVIIAFALRKRAPKLLHEDFHPKVVRWKVFALVLTAVGLALVV